MVAQLLITVRSCSEFPPNKQTSRTPTSRLPRHGHEPQASAHVMPFLGRRLSCRALRALQDHDTCLPCAASLTRSFAHGASVTRAYPFSERAQWKNDEASRISKNWGRKTTRGYPIGESGVNCLSGWLNSFPRWTGLSGCEFCVIRTISCHVVL